MSVLESAERDPVQRDWAVPESSPGGQRYGEELQAGLARELAVKEAGYLPRTEHKNEDGSPVYTNRLIRETSPYLLQHAHNPVNWYAWGEEAFADAERLDRPVLLSVGYSTCHWCHVMERESFEDEEIAAFINANYIPIKVDREERPDIDGVYMDAVRILSGGGGWPMTVIMTPAGRPFFGGTYFPARDGDRGARSGFLSILRYFAAQYADNRDELLERAEEITQRIQRQAAVESAAGIPGAHAFDEALVRLKGSYDDANGGFGRAPKFPRSVTLELLMRIHRRTGDEDALRMTVNTLKKMADGGMRDHVGGGFHRYSTDAKWLVPHFEKMLYDNALLAVAYLDAYQITGEASFAEVARTTLDYVLREMTDERGGFYSATDADSPTPGGHEEEGWFFTWTPEELEEVLGSREAKVFAAYYNVTAQGNFEGRSILHVTKNRQDFAAAQGLSPESLDKKLSAARKLLYTARAKRPPPGKDTKILTSWNGLMISALARGARVLNEPAYAKAALRAAVFIDGDLKDGKRLQRSWRAGIAKHNGVLDDYAFFAAGLLDLYETTHDTRWLAEAVALQIELRESFWDHEKAGYFFTPVDGERLLTREKPYYDGAEPSGNSVALLNLLRLYELTTNEGYLQMAEKSLKAFGTYLERASIAVPRMMGALDFYLDSPKEIVLVSKGGKADFSPFLGELAARYLPNCVLAVTEEGEAADKLARLVPLVEGKTAIAGKPTAYVCEKRTCKLPTNDPEVFAKQISTVVPLADR